MKKIALISSFCNDKNKINVLISNIKKLKEMNFDVLLISPIQLDTEVTKYCDYYFFTKDNPVYNWPCLLYTSPSPRDRQKSRMPSSA